MARPRVRERGPRRGASGRALPALGVRPPRLLRSPRPGRRPLLPGRAAHPVPSRPHRVSAAPRGRAVAARVRVAGSTRLLHDQLPVPRRLRTRRGGARRAHRGRRPVVDRREPGPRLLRRPELGPPAHRAPAGGDAGERARTTGGSRRAGGAGRVRQAVADRAPARPRCDAGAGARSARAAPGRPRLRGRDAGREPAPRPGHPRAVELVLALQRGAWRGELDLGGAATLPGHREARVRRDLPQHRQRPPARHGRPVRGPLRVARRTEPGALRARGRPRRRVRPRGLDRDEQGVEPAVRAVGLRRRRARRRPVAAARPARLRRGRRLPRRLRDARLARAHPLLRLRLHGGGAGAVRRLCGARRVDREGAVARGEPRTSTATHRDLTSGSTP